MLIVHGFSLVNAINDCEQGIKRLPTGGKSRFELFLYSSMVRVVSFLTSFVVFIEHVLNKAFLSSQIGVGGYFLQYIRGLIQDLLMQIGISEDLYIPVCKF